MNIKKVDDKPMVIHTKEKTKIHVKAQPETKIKGRNVLVVEKKPKIAGAGNEEQTDKRKSALKVRPDQIKKDDHKQQGKGSAKEEVRKSVQKEAGVYAQYQKSKADREKAIGKKNGTIKTAASVGAMTALDQMDGGNEVYDSYQVARTLSAPAVSAAEAGKRLYRTQVARAKAERIKKVQAGKKIGKKTVKESATKSAKHAAKIAAKETAKTAAKEATKEVAKEGTKAVTKAAVEAATTTAGTAVSLGLGTAIGIAAGYTLVLPETDADGNVVVLGEDVETPVIYVLIGESDHISTIADEGYTDEGFCEGYRYGRRFVFQNRCSLNMGI